MDKVKILCNGLVKTKKNIYLLLLFVFVNILFFNGIALLFEIEFISNISIILMLLGELILILLSEMASSFIGVFAILTVVFLLLIIMYKCFGGKLEKGKIISLVFLFIFMVFAIVLQRMK